MEPYDRWAHPDLLNSLPPDHATVSDEDGVFLTKVVTYDEIRATIKSMARGKSPGPDGLNVEFYLFYWDIIKEPLSKPSPIFSPMPIFPELGGKLS